MEMYNKKKKRNKKHEIKRFTSVAQSSFSHGNSHAFIRIIVLIAAAVFLVYMLLSKSIDAISNLEITRIKDIEVSASGNITKAEIKALLPFKEGDSTVKVNLRSAREQIKSVKPELKSLSIRRGWHKVKIKAQERTPEAFVKQSNSLMGIDSDLQVFHIRGFMISIKAPLITYKDEKEKEEILQFIKAVKSFDNNFFDAVASLNLSASKDFVFTTNESVIVYWGEFNIKNLNEKIADFKKVFANAKSRNDKIEYINMTLYDLGRVIVKAQKNKI